MGLTRLEIEAIKARGVSQLLHHLQEALTAACPPDLTDVAARTQSAWERILGEEAGANAEVLLNTLEPYQREIEHHFALEGQRRFRGLMAGYLHLFTRMKYAGSSLRDRIPFIPRSRAAVVTPSTWDLSTFTRACSDVAATPHARCPRQSPGQPPARDGRRAGVPARPAQRAGRVHGQDGLAAALRPDARGGAAPGGTTVGPADRGATLAANRDSLPGGLGAVAGTAGRMHSAALALFHDRKPTAPDRRPAAVDRAP